MPVRTDFYLLKQADEKSQLLTVCRIVEKAYLKFHQIFIYTQNESQSEILDKLLWTFHETSFIPHQPYESDSNSQILPPILISHAALTSPPVQDILVNLNSVVPDFFKSFQRIIEVVPEEPTARANAREKYRFYREQACELHSHNL
jgi:DNA polymerase-3 subunit chi